MMIDRPPKQIGVRELRDRLTSVMEDVKQSGPYMVMSNNQPMAVMISNEEAWFWERVEWALAALHGLEVYPELARGTSELALIVRGQRRFSQRELEGLARDRREIIENAHTVGVSDARLHMAEILDAVFRGKKWMLLSGGHFAVTMIRPKEYQRLQRLRRLVAWFRTAGLDLPEADEEAIAKWVREYRSAPAADAADEGSAIA
jgi:antitoxin (DNA-binding transcriptional repressor) of toxin-antitoxin stability system